MSREAEHDQAVGVITPTQAKALFTEHVKGVVQRLLDLVKPGLSRINWDGAGACFYRSLDETREGCVVLGADIWDASVRAFCDALRAAGWVVWMDAESPRTAFYGVHTEDALETGVFIALHKEALLSKVPACRRGEAEKGVK